MTFHLISKDEYGQTAIEGTGGDISELISIGKSRVSDVNVDNALTVYDKKRSWEAFFIELVDENEELIEDGVYSGLDNAGNHSVYYMSDDDYVMLDKVDGQVRVYLGNLDREDWFAEDERGEAITSITHKDLLNKTVFYIRKA